MRISSRFLCLSGAILLSAVVGCKNSGCSGGSCGGATQTGVPSAAATPVYGMSPGAGSAGAIANKYGSNASPIYSGGAVPGGQQSFPGASGGAQGFPSQSTPPNLGGM